MAPPASLSTTIRSCGSVSPAPSRSPAGVVQERDVPHEHGGFLAGRPARCPVAVDVVPSIPARPRLANMVACGSAGGAPARSTSRIPFEEPRTSCPRACFQTSAPTDGPVAAGDAARIRSTACCAAAPASSQASSQAADPRPAKSARSARVSSGSSVRRPGSYQATGTGWYRAEGTSARASSALTGRESVGRPKRTTRSIGCAASAAEVLDQQPVGPHRVGAEAGVGGRLGQQRQAVRAGESLGDRAGVVPGQHHGAPLRQRRRRGRKVQGQRVPRRPGRCRVRRPRAARRPRPGPAGRGRQGSAAPARAGCPRRLRWRR